MCMSYVVTVSDFARRWVLAAALSVVLGGCGGADPAPGNVATQAGSDQAGEARDATPAPQLSPLPSDLESQVTARHEYVPRIEVEPLLASTVGTFRLREALRGQQALVESTILAAESLQSAALLPEGGGLSAGTPRSILLQHSRLLRADAIRAFEENDLDAATRRLEASFRLGNYLLRHDDHDSRFRGGQIVVPTFLDCDALRSAGFVDRMTPANAAALAAALRAFDTSRYVTPWDATSVAGRALAATIAALEGRARGA